MNPFEDPIPAEEQEQPISTDEQHTSLARDQQRLAHLAKAASEPADQAVPSADRLLAFPNTSLHPRQRPLKRLLSVAAVC